MTRFIPLFLCAALMVPAAGCSGGSKTTSDAGMPSLDAGTDANGGGDDAGFDAGTPDAGMDAGSPGCTTGCNFVQVVSGAKHSCALRENGSVMCWGQNLNGELGDGRMGHSDCTPPGTTDTVDCAGAVHVATIDDATQITARGSISTCALRPGGHVWCWGAEHIMTGLGNTVKHYRPAEYGTFDAAMQISDGTSHMCAVLTDGTVQCVGNDGSGELGDGSTNRQGAAVAVGGLSNVTDVQAGFFSFTCALNDTGVWCWGDNQAGQLGDGNGSHHMCMDSTSSYDCSLSPVQATTLTGATQLAAGNENACAVMSDHTVMCWGDNALGQLGQGNTDAASAPVAVPGITNATKVTVGIRHACAILDTGHVMCWGANDYGQLGDGISPVDGHATMCSNRGDLVDCSPTPVEVSGIDDAVDIAAGWYHTCVIRSSGEIWCWGQNDSKQLGDGTREIRAAPVMVMGLD